MRFLRVAITYTIRVSIALLLLSGVSALLAHVAMELAEINRLAAFLVVVWILSVVIGLALAIVDEYDHD